MNYQRGCSQIPGEKHMKALMSCKEEQILKRLKFPCTETPFTMWQRYMANSLLRLTSQICSQLGWS